MNKIFYVLLLISNLAFAQVGIGTTTPQGALDITSTTSGILIPRLTSAQKLAILTPATGLLVFQTDGVSGFYYYTGAIWVQVSGWGLIGNANTVPATNFIGTTDAQPLITRTNNVERTRTLSTGQVGIGTSTPVGALDITSTTDGLLIPRVALSATNVSSPVLTPTISEIVYNTFTSAVGVNQVVPDFYYWDGTKWVPRMGVHAINAAGTVLTNVYTYSGVLTLNSGGLWNIDITTLGLTTITNVQLTAERTTTDIRYIPSISITASPTITNVSFAVSDSNTIGILGAEGLEYTTSGGNKDCKVHITITGTK